MKAYTAIEECSGEYSGTVVFANSNVEARRMAADEINDGEFGGLRVMRQPELDSYYKKPIPLEIMIDLGWWTGCSNCGIEIKEDLYYDDYHDDYEYYKNERPCGSFNGAGFCSAGCQEQWRAKKSQEPIIKYRMPERLRAIAEQYVINPVFDETKNYCYITWVGDAAPFVSCASVTLAMPGAGTQQLSVNFKTTMAGEEEVHLFLPYTEEGKAAYRRYATAALDTLLDSR